MDQTQRVTTEIFKARKFQSLIENYATGTALYILLNCNHRRDKRAEKWRANKIRNECFEREFNYLHFLAKFFFVDRKDNVK